MHPIERLRFVARASGAPIDDVVREAAASLAGFADDPASLVTACRRLIDRHPANGPVWWLCARTLLAADPADEAWRCHAELHVDPTVDELSHALPDGAAVAVVGWPERLGAAVAPRGDLEVRVLDADGDGPGFVRMLERLDVAAVDVPVGGAAAAVASSDLVVLDGAAIGPEAAVVDRGSWAAAAVARTAGVPVWLVGGVGRTLPSGLWSALTARLDRPGRAPWERDLDVVPLALVHRVVLATGPVAPSDLGAHVDAPDAPELRR